MMKKFNYNKIVIENRQLPLKKVTYQCKDIKYKFEVVTQKIEESKQNLQQEIEDRIEENKQNLQKLNKKIHKLHVFLESELRDERILGQDKIIKVIQENKESRLEFLHEMVKERKERYIKQIRFDEIEHHIVDLTRIQIDMMKKFIELTKNDMINTGNKIKQEIDNRLDQQHQMIDSLYSGVGMIQKTLKIIGNDYTI